MMELSGEDEEGDLEHLNDTEITDSCDEIMEEITDSSDENEDDCEEEM